MFGFNNDDWSENYGPLPTDLRHTLNVSGFVGLPRRFQLSFNVSAYSRAPFSVFVDFNGDGTQNDLPPGTRVNQFDRGLGCDDLVRLVESYNREFAGRPTTGGQTAPPLTLPADFAFGDGFSTQDLRLPRRRRARAPDPIRRVFNLLNTANLVGCGGNLASPGEFGQPGARSTQVFGPGGPRASQFGARVSFRRTVGDWDWVGCFRTDHLLAANNVPALGCAPPVCQLIKSTLNQQHLRPRRPHFFVPTSLAPIAPRSSRAGARALTAHAGRATAPRRPVERRGAAE